MFNLIRRDVIIQKRQLLIFIPFILIFIISDKHPALIFLVASIIIPYNTYTHDEKAETNILLNSLPLYSYNPLTLIALLFYKNNNYHIDISESS